MASLWAWTRLAIVGNPCPYSTRWDKLRRGASASHNTTSNRGYIVKAYHTIPMAPCLLALSLSLLQCLCRWTCTATLIGCLETCAPHPQDAPEPLVGTCLAPLYLSACNPGHLLDSTGNIPQRDHGSIYLWHPTDQPVCGHRRHYPTSEGKVAILSLNACMHSIHRIRTSQLPQRSSNKEKTKLTKPGNRVFFIRWSPPVPSGRVIPAVLLPTASSSGSEPWLRYLSEAGWFCRRASGCPAENNCCLWRRIGEEMRGWYRYLEGDDDQGMYMLSSSSSSPFGWGLWLIRVDIDCSVW